MKQLKRFVLLLVIAVLALLMIAADAAPEDQVMAILQVAIPVVLAIGVPIVTAILKAIMDKLSWERATKRDVVSVLILILSFFLVLILCATKGILPPLPSDVGQAATQIITWAFAILGGAMFAYNTVIGKILKGTGTETPVK